MKRLTDISLLGAAGMLFAPAAVAARPSGPKAPERPNVIIVLADDLGYGDLSCYGHPTIKTPNIDRMAAEGMRATEFYAGAGVSTPSRASMLTGRYSVRTGLWGDKWSVLFPDTPGGLPTDEVTFAQMMQQQGYATACIGKWHLGAADPHMPWNFGFDYYYGVPYANNFRPLPLMEGARILEDSTDQSLLTQRYTARVKDFIKKSASEKKPFLVYYSSTFPHIPLFASKDFLGKSLRGAYGDTVEELDWSVGEIIKTLKELGVDDNTLVIFTSDNGPWITVKLRGGSSGLLRSGKGSSWEGGFRVPAIFRWPGVVPAGSTCYNMCSMQDFFPTLANLCGGALPQGVEIDGVDMTPMLKDPEQKVRNEMAYWRGSELAALRRGVWKIQFHRYEEWYILNNIPDDGKPLLFNVQSDPSETVDLAAKHPEVVQQLTALRDSYMRRVKIRPSVNDMRVTD